MEYLWFTAGHCYTNFLHVKLKMWKWPEELICISILCFQNWPHHPSGGPSQWAWFDASPLLLHAAGQGVASTAALHADSAHRKQGPLPHEHHAPQGAPEDIGVVCWLSSAGGLPGNGWCHHDCPAAHWPRPHLTGLLQFSRYLGELSHYYTV